VVQLLISAKADLNAQTQVPLPTTTCVLATAVTMGRSGVVPVLPCLLYRRVM
jgi:hypothetical protein